MNHDMFSNNKNDELDSNFIYPRTYVDPTTYINVDSSDLNQEQNTKYNNISMDEYMTYMNSYMKDSISEDNNTDCNYDYYPYLDMNNNYNDNEDIFQNQFKNNNMNMMPGMQYMNSGIMPCQVQCVPNNMMMPGMMNPYMITCMMFPTMMNPYMMMSNMHQVNLEEFDEEEM